MEIEKTLTVAAPRERVWTLLLDPQVMTGAVPGMQSIEVLSPTEYTALMKVKISFISAKFKLNTRIVEQREPEYLRAEGTGEDASVASSLKQTSEIFLSETPDGGTELKLRVNVDLLGRLGTFGLSVMKTKADRLWEEFAKNLAQRLEQGPALTQADEPAPKAGSTAGAKPEPLNVEAAEKGPAISSSASSTPVSQPFGPAASASAHPDSEYVGDMAEPQGWWSRLLGGNRATVARSRGNSSSVIRVEIRQMDRTVAVEWPVEAAGQCQQWLRELLTGRG